MLNIQGRLERLKTDKMHIQFDEKFKVILFWGLNIRHL